LRLLLILKGMCETKKQSSSLTGLSSCPSGYPNDCGNGYCCEGNRKCHVINNENSTTTICIPPSQSPSCPENYPNDCGNGYCCPKSNFCASDSECIFNYEKQF
jgi:hypothetical protein